MHLWRRLCSYYCVMMLLSRANGDVWYHNHVKLLLWHSSQHFPHCLQCAMACAVHVYFWLCCSSCCILLPDGQKHGTSLKLPSLLPLSDMVLFCIQYSRWSITMKVFAEMRSILKCSHSGAANGKVTSLVHLSILLILCLCFIFCFAVGLFSSRVQKGTLFHFYRKLFRRISIFGC